MTDTTSRKRQPKGVTTGGQFATEARTEPKFDLPLPVAIPIPSHAGFDAETHTPQTTAQLRKVLDNSRLRFDKDRVIVLPHNAKIDSDEARFIGAPHADQLTIDIDGFVPFHVADGHANIKALSSLGNSATADRGAVINVETFGGLKTRINAMPGSFVNVHDCENSSTAISWYEGSSLNMDGERYDFNNPESDPSSNATVRRISRQMPGHPEFGQPPALGLSPVEGGDLGRLDKHLAASRQWYEARNDALGNPKSQSAQRALKQAEHDYVAASAHYAGALLSDSLDREAIIAVKFDEQGVCELDIPQCKSLVQTFSSDEVHNHVYQLLCEAELKAPQGSNVLRVSVQDLIENNVEHE